MNLLSPTRHTLLETKCLNAWAGQGGGGVVLIADAKNENISIYNFYLYLYGIYILNRIKGFKFFMRSLLK